MDKNIVCNKCSRPISNENELELEDYLQVNKEWGYFSKKDGKIHSFVICENCYDQFVSGFAVPVNEKDKIELL